MAALVRLPAAPAYGHLFDPDRRIQGLPVCRCGLPFGAAVHYRPVLRR